MKQTVAMNYLLTLWLFAALLCPLWAYAAARVATWSKNRTDTCKPAPNWTIHTDDDEVEPMKSFPGDVIVVVLLKASRSFSLTQASKIKVLRRRLGYDNITEVSFLIVNAQDTESRDKYWKLKKTAPTWVPVFQQDVNATDVWEILGGVIDDFLIYDRCGLLTYHIGMPWSFYFNQHVQAAIQVTYISNICNCSVTTSSVKPKSRLKVTISEGEVPEYPEYPEIYHSHHDHLEHWRLP